MVNRSSTPALLVLQDGTVFKAKAFGYLNGSEGEVVFNTSMTGYQEILTDPSYAGQIVTMTYPMIGNCGVNEEDVESSRPQVAGLIVKDYVEKHSNFRATLSLGEYLFRHKIVGLTDVETRALVRHLRERGAMPGLISLDDFDLKRLKKKAKHLPSMEGQDWVQKVTTHESYPWKELPWQLGQGYTQVQNKEANKHHIVAMDFGLKRNILRNLTGQNMDVTVVPAQTDYYKIMDLEPDGVFLSNGPGDPAVVTYAIETVSKLVGKVPLFGICLGHQILALALGAKTYKLKFGHRGGNHPVKDLSTGKVHITAQNHGFAVHHESLPADLEVNHLNLNDKTVEGFRHKKYPAFAVQYHPEASPGPHDSLYLFERFKQMIEVR